MKLIHAKDLPRKPPVPKFTLEEKVDRFINDELASGIVDAAQSGQNRFVTRWQNWMNYETKTAMLTAFNNKFNPFGYTVSFSHDGAGIYETIVVKWAWQV